MTSNFHLHPVSISNFLIRYMYEYNLFSMFTSIPLFPDFLKSDLYLCQHSKFSHNFDILKLTAQLFPRINLYFFDVLNFPIIIPVYAFW